MVKQGEIESVMDLPAEVIGTFFKQLRMSNGSFGTITHKDVVTSVMGKMNIEDFEEGIRICKVIMDECRASIGDFHPYTN